MVRRDKLKKKQLQNKINSCNPDPHNENVSIFFASDSFIVLSIQSRQVHQ